MNTKIILSRHTDNVDDIPTQQGIDSLVEKVNRELSEIVWINWNDMIVISSPKNRAKVTAKTIAEQVWGTNISPQVVEYLDYEIPVDTKNKKLKEIAKQFDILNKEFPNYNWNAHLFLQTIRNNGIEWVSFNKISKYYLEKLYKTISILNERSKDEKKINPKLIIWWTHCGYIIETILFALFWEDEKFEEERWWYVDLWDSVSIDINLDSKNIVFKYRNIKKEPITFDDLKKKIEILEKAN